MTFQDSTSVSNVQAQPVFALVPVNHTAMAQLLADEDYDAVLALTHDGPLAADAYHVAYQRYVRDHRTLGAGPLCNCDLCRQELGEVAQ
jgi:hypothetical protein